MRANDFPGPRALVELLSQPEYADVCLDVTNSKSGGEFREFVETRHGELWFLRATQAEWRAEVEAYRRRRMVH